MSRSAASPRVFQLYSPRRPSPLGLPPLAPHTDMLCSSIYPKTPERYYYQHNNNNSVEPNTSMRFPPEVHHDRRNSIQRAARASPPAPLSLDVQHHPAAAAAAIIHHLPSIEENLQPDLEMSVPPSPTPSSTSSLSLYSAESAKKTLEIGEEGERVEKKKGGGFCLCFNFSALFGSTKSKPNKILAPQAQAQVLAAEPAPAPQMVQHRRRPPSLVLVR